MLNEYQSEHPNYSGDGIVEFKDPTREDELAFFETVKKMKEDKRKMKVAANNMLAKRVSGALNDEDEERVINQFDYI